MKRNEAQLQFDTLSIEGGLFTAEWMGKVASFKAPGQSDADYNVRAGFEKREEIALAWRSAQHLWGQFKAARQASGIDAWGVTQRFVTELLRQSFGFANLRAVEHPQEIDGRRYPVGHFAVDQSVPVVISPCAEQKLLDTPHDRLGDSSGDRLRRRSAFGLLQEYLNAADHALWGIASNGLLLRMARDNGSLTRPAWLEADLERLFEEENQAEFSVLWLLLHASRFGSEGQAPHNCILEQWRNGCRDQGIQARGLLRQNVEQALEDLGQGFVGHPANTALREALGNGSLSTRDYFRQLLRLVYRLIFLLTVEERGILHPPGSLESAKGLFERGYSLKRLRDKAVRRSAHDRHHDLWEGLKRVWLGLAGGELRLALPALGGLFSTNQCSALDGAKLENRHLLAALFHLAWLRDAPGEPLTRVNWRDMGSEELGGIYESLLELTPQLAHDNRHFSFLEGAATKGNARKTSGSYYTPDSLVQELLDSALEPVVADRLAPHGGALASGEAAAQALLSITVCDPACGSGHFILAAARRLATHLARVLAEGSQPTPDDYRHALRQVVAHSIHGVDLNPMAVELAKISLWLEAVEPGKPLSFLDHHIKVGNSLLGATNNLIRHGIPDDAFKPISGDLPEIANWMKKLNQAARTGQKIFDFKQPEVLHRLTPLPGALAQLEALDDDTPEAVAKKEDIYRQLVESSGYENVRLVYDAWCAAFVWPKDTADSNMVLTTEHLRVIQEDPESIAPRLRDQIRHLAKRYSFFHWHLEFPTVFDPQGNGGFDVTLGNPPWERTAFEEIPYFVTRVPEIAQAETTALRQKLILSLRNERPDIWERYQSDLRFAEGQEHIVGNGGLFRLSFSGRANTFALFTELALIHTNKSGFVGLVIPTALATDTPYSDFWSDIVKNRSVVSMFDFENKGIYFPNVHSSYKFSLFTFRPISYPSTRSRFGFYLANPTEISVGNSIFEIPQEVVARINPITHLLPVCRSIRDFKLLAGLYKNDWFLANQGTPWVGFTSSATSEIWQFNEDEASPDNDLISLWEAKCIHQFNHRFASYAGTSRNEKLAGTPRIFSNAINPDAKIVTRYLVPRDAWQKHISARQIYLSAACGYRDVARATDERTMISAIVPFAGFMQPLNGISHDSPINLLRLVACLNSFVLDFACRQKTPGTHVNVTICKQLPTVPDSEYQRLNSIVGINGGEWVLNRAIELTYTDWDLESFAHDCGFDTPPFRWEEARRFQLRCELDAAFFHLYEIDREDVAYIMDTFPIIKRKDETRYAKYRTRETILAIYDEMATAKRTGHAFTSQLDPPPADPRCCHPLKNSSSHSYASIGVIRHENDAHMAGLIFAVIRHAGSLPRQTLSLALVTLQHGHTTSSDTVPADAAQIEAYRESHVSILSSATDRLQEFLRFFETTGAIRFQHQGAVIEAVAGAPFPPGVLVDTETEVVAGLLLQIASATLERQASADQADTAPSSAKQA